MPSDGSSKPLSDSSSKPRPEPHLGPDPHAEIRNDAKTVNIALQGGGAHGAFAWGVLDHLLEDGRLDVYGISGASAGAMNAVVLGIGSTGGREGGRAALEGFWRRVSDAGSPPAGQPSPRCPRSRLSAWRTRRLSRSST